MRGFLLTVLVVTVVTLCAQGVHFAYYKFFYPHESVLDDYVDKQIQAAESLEELVTEYELAMAVVEEYEAQTPEADRPSYGNRNQEPYSAESRLKRAIETWESRARDYARLWYQWIAGLMLFIGGAVLTKFGRGWLGTALIVAGLGEMIWWSSPSFRAGGSLYEYDKLLNAKLILTVLTFVIVIFVWQLYERTFQKSQSSL
jgi:hypothetical protein